MGSCIYHDSKFKEYEIAAGVSFPPLHLRHPRPLHTGNPDTSSCILQGMFYDFARKKCEKSFFLVYTNETILPIL